MSASQDSLPQSRAGHWQLRSGRLTFGGRPALMGIVNVTPDSFSDGGLFLDTARAVEHGLRLADQGADIIDVGGESTRPYAIPVPAEEELRRVIPVVSELCRRTAVPVSIDTRKAAVAREALAAGAEIINDVTGLEGDPDMAPLAVETGAAVCVMHMQGSPQTMQDRPHYEDVVEDVLAYLRRRRDELVARGLAAERIALDPGIGFGKTAEHNLQLLRHAERFHRLGCPVLVGHSRKSFIRQVIGRARVDPLPGTLAVSLALARQGIQVLRVHDVAAVRQALALFEATGGLA